MIGNGLVVAIVAFYLFACYYGSRGPRRRALEVMAAFEGAREPRHARVWQGNQVGGYWD